jgi:16S rRNA G966 N2-methylase RsmD
MSNMRHVAEELQVGRSDPVYQAHAYLTKVPVPAIIPFIEAYTRPGELIVDPFAGSGMTGVAAAMLGRSARLFDISVLGRHIGRNYLNLIDAPTLEKCAQEAVARAKSRVGNVYGLRCSSCGREATLAKTVWSIRVACSSCGEPVNYYRALEAANWLKPEMACDACGHEVARRSPRIDEEPVFDSVSCICNPRQIEQAVTKPPDLDLDSVLYPRVQITPDRQMYKIQGLGKNRLTSIASFYSPRNLAALTALHQEICSLDDTAVRDKLLFAFTACLARASKRYQWSHQGPLNAANAYYYISPVFYEWNVYDLFNRKVQDAMKSDEKIRSTRQLYADGDSSAVVDVEYDTCSAERIPLDNNSADYIFTDPPFGSNLFYADMALFHEAWLGSFTNHSQEAVIDKAPGDRNAARYESLLVDSLSECRRILKPGRHISMVFGNSSGRMWALLQRAIQDAHLKIIPEALVILNKGQRSVKGLASGFEHIATLDLVITMAAADSPPATLQHVSKSHIIETTRRLALMGNAITPSHLYLELLRTGIRECWKLDELDLRTVTEFLTSEGWEIETKTGKLRKVPAGAALN